MRAKLTNLALIAVLALAVPGSLAVAKGLKGLPESGLEHRLKGDDLWLQPGRLF